MKDQEKSIESAESPISGNDGYGRDHRPCVTMCLRRELSFLYSFSSINYFLAQYDKVVLSYIQADVIRTLSLSSSEYGILSG